MKDLDVLLEKHGLPTYGSEDVKKERLKRNNLWPWDTPKKEDKPLVEIKAEAKDKTLYAFGNEKKADPLDAALEALKTPSNEAYKSAFPPAKKLGRPAKVK